MITSEQALDIILDSTNDYGVEEVPFIDSLGRTLKEDIRADRPFPPFDRVSMDGIALQHVAFSQGRRHFEIEGTQAAGTKPLSLKSAENCIEVMTGAVLPANTDTVVPYEWLKITEDQIKIIKEEVSLGQNVHFQGKDRKENDVLIKKNMSITPAEMGVLTTVGKTSVKVAKQPKVLIISTGDELVEAAEDPKAYQIRKSNVHTLVALLKKLNIKATAEHLVDDKTILKEKIENFLEVYDVLIFSGGVSKGKYDFLPEVLHELGVEKKFHKVKQRPGKPFWFGNKEKKIIFAFPGNPVSTFVGCLKYFYPWYKKSVGLVFENHQKAILAEDYNFNPELTYFLQVRVENKKGLLLAVPVAGNGSGDLANLAFTDAFLELPDDRSEFKTGEVFPLLLYRNG